MNKTKYIWKILKDRWLTPYDKILIRFNTKAETDDKLVWRIFINGVEHLASGFEVEGYIYDQVSNENDILKFNIGCYGRVRWRGTKAFIITANKTIDV